MNTFFLIFRTLRPKQWTKNFFIFAAILFSQNIAHPWLFFKTIAAFIFFCLTSGAVYIINDLCDQKTDKQHPTKSHRPIASGQLKSIDAIISLGCIIPISFIFAYILNYHFFLILLCYFIVQLAYSFYVKNIIILDVFIVAFGFVLRVISGAVLIDVKMSSWLILCTILIALFLALSKRRHEMVLLETKAHIHRKTLSQYSPYLLDQMISVVTASTVITYALYTMSEETVKKFGTKNLIFTVPLVLYGIFRYLYLIHERKFGGNPEETLLNDKPLLISIFLWIITVITILYFY